MNGKIIISSRSIFTSVITTPEQTNTDVNALRKRMADVKQIYEEMMLREIARFNEEMDDLDEEIQEGMSNRIGSGFLANEAPKYANRLVRPILRDSVQDLETIEKTLTANIATMVGEGFVQGTSEEVGGMIGAAGFMNIEMSELGIQKLMPPTEDGTTTT